MESIELASGLGALHSAVVLAHEYTHAWLWLHDFPPLPAPLEEGICELGLRVAWAPCSRRSAIPNDRRKL